MEETPTFDQSHRELQRPGWLAPAVERDRLASGAEIAGIAEADFQMQLRRRQRVRRQRRLHGGLFRLGGSVQRKTGDRNLLRVEVRRKVTGGQPQKTPLPRVPGVRRIFRTKVRGIGSAFAPAQHGVIPGTRDRAGQRDFPQRTGHRPKRKRGAE